ncbi:probable sphingolipid transporter spinster homolog 2 [Salvia splendens]|uniref:probable sphingolipid transporter spinster homolog 2 n=1 Tax=Salvia splendens TaxID=180675 RepID=UPI001C27848B|nr:probable sphingolipid transporter spinster homolog 2 [Salvia splendens]
MGEEENTQDPNSNPSPNSNPGPNPNPDLSQAPGAQSAAVTLETEKEAGTDMARASTSLAPKPSWFTPKRLLAIFCVINLINYIDRGAIASNGVNGSVRTCSESGVCTPGSGIQGEFDMTNFEDGVISSAFMVGLLVASPIFASTAKSVNPFRLIGIGLTVWTVAVTFCGFSFNFWSIAVARMLVGVGEASFISLAAPFIDDNAPVTQRIAWLGAFYMCIPTGVAVGYVYGGLISTFGWRWAFWVEALLMLPFAILGFVMKPLQLKGFGPAEASQPLTAADDTSEDQGSDLATRGVVGNESSKSLRFGALTTFGKDMQLLLLNKVYVVNVLGYIAYNFVIGAYSYWGPKAGYNIYHMSNADYMFGGVTAICGVFGSIAGGLVLDRMNSTLPNAFKLLSVATLLGAAFCFAAFCFHSLYVFLALFAIGELLVFATQAPVNFVCLHCVKPSLRPLSMAMSTVSIHIFGDVPSSPLVGLLQDRINNWRVTALTLTSILFVAGAIWVIGIFMPAVDRYNEDAEHPAPLVDKSNSTPLLTEKMAEPA